MTGGVVRMRLVYLVARPEDVNKRTAGGVYESRELAENPTFEAVSTTLLI